jgi:predicted dehydrogenase
VSPLAVNNEQGAWKMEGDVVRIGLLGCGTISQFAHIPALTRAQGIQFAAICDGGSDLLETIGARAGVSNLFTDYREFLEKGGIDAVLIAAPDEFHLPLARQALEAGKHVLVEKPLAVDSNACMQLLQVVEQSGRKLQVGCMKRHDPGIAFAQTFVKERLGEIISASGWYRDSLFRYEMQTAILPRPVTSPRSIRPAADPKTSDRRHYSLVTHGAHLFDTLRFLAGDVSSVNAALAEKCNQYSWHGLLHFESGALGHFELSVKTSGDYAEGYLVHGEHGSVEIQTFLPFYYRPSKVRAFDGRTQQWHTPLGANSNPYKNQIEAFARAILEDRPTNPDAADGWAAVSLLEGVEESVNRGARVTVEGPVRT